MGKRLDGFVIRLEFDPDGGVAAAFYEDAEGCGHERGTPLSETLDDVVGYHLNHYRRSHNMVPQPWCESQLELADGTVLRCTTDPRFPHDEHMFRWRR